LKEGVKKGSREVGILRLLQEMRVFEENRLFTLGRQVVPYLTREDMLQPNDFPELDSNPEFRYQEGVVAGLASAIHAIKAADPLSAKN
jgi:hypothetical protein